MIRIAAGRGHLPGAILPHTKIRSAVRGKRVTLKHRRPFEVEPVHHLLAAVACGLAQFPAGLDLERHDRADRRVHDAEEKLQVGTTVEFDQREVLLNFQARFGLVGVAEEIGVGGVGAVVRDVLAERNGDGHALVLTLVRALLHVPVEVGGVDRVVVRGALGHCASGTNG